jgi:hypothetical protein
VCKTSKELWDKLKSLYESSSLSRRMLLRNKLNACRMAEGESVYSYLDRAKEIGVSCMMRDQLHDAGDKISNEEIVPIALNVFSNDYEMFFSSVACKEILPTF